MSTATAVEAPAPAKGKKKLILIATMAALVLAGGGGAAVVMMKNSAAAAQAYEDEAEDVPARVAAAHDSKAAPVFVPLDSFTVNLADRNADRYAQVGITLEIDDTKTGDRIKAYMPAIRNNILMAIADRTAADLLGREGKAQLAERIKREASRALGYEVDEDDEAEATDATPAKGRKNRKRAAAALPVKSVHFSNFIIQ